MTKVAKVAQDKGENVRINASVVSRNGRLSGVTERRLWFFSVELLEGGDGDDHLLARSPAPALLSITERTVAGDHDVALMRAHRAGFAPLAVHRSAKKVHAGIKA